MNDATKANIVTTAAKSMISEGCTPLEVRVMREVIELPAASQALLYDAVRYARERVTGEPARPA